MATLCWSQIFEIITLITYILMSANMTQGIRNENEVKSQIDSKLKLLNRPAVKSIQNSDGDIIDCVDIYKQPALDHPALKNHTIQMTPSYIPVSDSLDKMEPSTNIPALQIWRKSGSCPQGTIPIRRVRKEDLLRYDDIESFGRKNPQVSPGRGQRGFNDDHTLVINNTIVNLGPLVNRSTAMLVATGVKQHFIGSRATVNVWNPGVETPEEYTTSQLWLLGGGPQDFESVESGWTVNQKLYGDNLTRFFVYWTNDAAKSTGCFDLYCSGFVHTTMEVALGAAIWPMSFLGGQQFYINITISMDPKTKNWWLHVFDKEVGYWPGSLFSKYLKSSATMAQWGGEVYSPNVRAVSPHTATAMGSGNFPEGMSGSASFITNIRVLDLSGAWTYPHQYVGIYSDENSCYAAFHDVPGYMTEPILYFGGPGRNPRCP